MRIVQEHGENVRIVEAAVEANAAQKARMVRKIREMLGGTETGKTIAVLGLTFKPETDDMRDAPALTILPALLEKGAKIRAHDPKGMDEAKKYLPDSIDFRTNAYEAAEGADCIVLLTEWNQYRALDLQKLKKCMKVPVFIDLRNVYDPTTMHNAGFRYTGVGRK
jgi:UDPglucose 6-dehydrogenase